MTKTCPYCRTELTIEDLCWEITEKKQDAEYYCSQCKRKVS